jgi:hypothetical protein
VKTNTITTDEIMDVMEDAIDKMADIHGRKFTESEECHLHVFVSQWLQGLGIDVVDSPKPDPDNADDPNYGVHPMS